MRSVYCLSKFDWTSWWIQLFIQSFVRKLKIDQAVIISRDYWLIEILLGKICQVKLTHWLLLLIVSCVIFFCWFKSGPCLIAGTFLTTGQESKPSSNVFWVSNQNSTVVCCQLLLLCSCCVAVVVWCRYGILSLIFTAVISAYPSDFQKNAHTLKFKIILGMRGGGFIFKMVWLPLKGILYWKTVGSIRCFALRWNSILFMQGISFITWTALFFIVIEWTQKSNRRIHLLLLKLKTRKCQRQSPFPSLQWVTCSTM